MGSGRVPLFPSLCKVRAGAGQPGAIFCLSFPNGQYSGFLLFPQPTQALSVFCHPPWLSVHLTQAPPPPTPSQIPSSPTFSSPPSPSASVSQPPPPPCSLPYLPPPTPSDHSWVPRPPQLTPTHPRVPVTWALPSSQASPAVSILSGSPSSSPCLRQRPTPVSLLPLLQVAHCQLGTSWVAMGTTEPLRKLP